MSLYSTSHNVTICLCTFESVTTGQSISSITLKSHLMPFSPMTTCGHTIASFADMPILSV